MSIRRTVVGSALVFVLLVCGVATSQDSDGRDRYKVFQPLTSDADLQAAFDDPSYEWYTEDERPKFFQHDFQSGTARWISVYKDIGPGGPRYSNGNGEWPWADPSTGKQDGNVRNVILAKVNNVNSSTVNVPRFSIVTSYNRVVRLEPRAGVNARTWQFGPGTDFIELVTNRILGADYTFKVHRMTLQDDNTWNFRVYRPLTTQQEYEEATNTKAESLGTRTLKNPHMVKIYEETREVYSVPRIEPELARKILLETPFKLCTTEDFIPTTSHEGQIYPKDYLGVFIGNAIDQDNCRNCHKDVLTDVRRIDNGEWYGLIRGGGKDRHGAGVFSWYPK